MMKSFLLGKSFFLLLLATISSNIVSVYSQSNAYETHISRRDRNLDHWDADTLAAYLNLDPDTGKPLPEGTSPGYVGIDASVMFYAQWCTNCHKFAPVWDTIGQLVKAGTTESNLIMALFNCELNEQHTRLCDAAGVTHYPTLLFIGAGTYHDTDMISKAVRGDKAAGPYGVSKIDRTVKFQGNLNIGDSVLDWIKTMQGLSTWHKWNHYEGGWLKSARALFGNPFGKKVKMVQNTALPIGIPPTLGTGGQVASNEATRSDSKLSPHVLKKELEKSETKISALDKDLKDSKLATTHAGYLIESFLFPSTRIVVDGKGENKTIHSDVFATMVEKDAWDASYEAGQEEFSDNLLLKSCVVDLTLDYCTRVTTRLTTEYLATLKDLPDSEYPSFSEMETELTEYIIKDEPYCGTFSDCNAKGFKPEETCRPKTCPFERETGCHYVASCLTDSIKEEYKEAWEEVKTIENETKSATEADTA